MKQKTKSALKKRVKITGSGKMIFCSASQNHLKSSKSTKTLRNKRHGRIATKGHLKGFKAMAAGNI